MTDPHMTASMPVFTLGSVDKKLFQINDGRGGTYILEVDLPLRLMAVLMQHGTDLANNQISTAAIDDLITGMTQMFQRHSPDMTRDELIDLFTVSDLIQLLQIVFTLMRGGATAATEAATAPTGGKATTTKPARSKKSTGAANSAPASTPHKHSDQPAVKVTQDWPPQPE